MSLPSHNNPRRRAARCLRILFAVLVLRSGAWLHAETAGQAFLMDGRMIPGWIQRVDSEGILWKAPSGQIGTFPMQNLREIRLLPPPDFRAAVQQLEAQPNETAITVLTAYADTANPDSYYPVPGNLASRAAWMLFRHYQKQGEAVKAAAWALRTEPELIPQIETPPLLDLYQAFAAPPDDTFFTQAEAFLNESDLSLAPEVEYLRAVAHEMRGETTYALTGYARVFSPGGGHLNAHGRLAIERSIRLLETNPPETVSQPAQLIESLQKTLDSLYNL